MVRLLTIALVFATLSGCGGSKVALRDALVEYTRGLRWGMGSTVARRIAPSQRDAYAQRRAIHQGLRIVGCQVAGVKLENKKSALVHLQVDWYLAHQGRVRRSLILQRWKRRKDRWEVASERPLRGARFPLLML